MDDLNDVMKELYNRYELSMIDRGRTEGRAEGIVIGHLEGRGEFASRLLATEKFTISDISALTGYSEESLETAIQIFIQRW